MTVSVATTWMDLLNAGGTVFVLAFIIYYATRMLPVFLKRWGEHTEALTNIANELQNLKDEVKELRHELDSK